MVNKLRSKIFYNLHFYQKQIELERFLLNHSDCEIGDLLLCFEDRSLNFDPRFSPEGHAEKNRSFTVGKVYKILDKKSKTDKKIKIMGDKNKHVWTTTKRFLGQKALRKLKLEELNKISKTRKLYYE